MIRERLPVVQGEQIEFVLDGNTITVRRATAATNPFAAWLGIAPLREEQTAGGLMQELRGGDEAPDPHGKVGRAPASSTCDRASPSPGIRRARVSIDTNIIVGIWAATPEGQRDTLTLQQLQQGGDARVWSTPNSAPPLE